MSHRQLCFLMLIEISAVKKAYCYRAFKEQRQNSILFQITKFIICYIQEKKKTKQTEYIVDQPSCEQSAPV